VACRSPTSISRRSRASSRVSSLAAARPAHRRQRRQATGATAPATADERGVTRLQRHIHDGPRHVRLHPNAGSVAATHYLTSWANSGLMQCNKCPRYSITLSARATNVAGTVTPIALAVLRLITSSNLVGCRTGMSAILVPWRAFATNRALISRLI
jgi:hypothetical protein